MDLSIAYRIARRLKERMAPHCHRVEIAGSVRRKKPEVGDIEIVAVPKTYTTKRRRSQGDMFGEQFELIERSELVDECLARLPNVQWIKTNGSVKSAKAEMKRQKTASGLTYSSPLEKGAGGIEPLDMRAELSPEKGYGANRLHWKGISQYMGEPFQIDLFLTESDRFGATWLIRTGSAGFNRKLIGKLKAAGLGFHGGDFVRYRYGSTETISDIIYCPEEIVIFRQLGLGFVPPEQRTEECRYLMTRKS